MNEGEGNGSYLTCGGEEETQRRTKRQAVQSSTERKDFNEADLSPSFKHVNPRAVLVFPV